MLDYEIHKLGQSGVLDTSPGKLKRPMIDSKLMETINEYLNSCEAVQTMIRASDANRPAIEAVAESLHNVIGEVIREHGVKQQIGKLVRSVMESNGYEHHAFGRTTRDRYFSSASVYTRRIRD